MVTHIEVGSDVLVFGKYEGILLETVVDQVVVYCPAFDPVAPYLVTDVSNVIVLQSQTTLFS